MFYKIISRFFLKKIINKRLSILKEDSSEGKIQTIGIIIDETEKGYKKELLKHIADSGIPLKQLKVLTFKDAVKKKGAIEKPGFSGKDISLTGSAKKEEVAAFLATPFDVLVNYFDENKPELLWATTSSKAKFRVGLDSVDYRANNVIVKTDMQETKLFTNELFKYLRILKKV
ncbi:hypothetical protein DI487_12130 [Flavobacterium sediminis]|uniref:Uncharacterized protein n=1 Tax=Flavobacterium sediminis TaxID=2201181 RepID=A0A2U8QWW0_9FLAO|nr:hypothetical protein [Flavobacterium sediminis]AWM14531.1 hypothetical protein DI487_12130 [Flavobacterium sediminis]